jgi:hypothetical protein
MVFLNKLLTSSLDIASDIHFGILISMENTKNTLQKARASKTVRIGVIVVLIIVVIILYIW